MLIIVAGKGASANRIAGALQSRLQTSLWPAEMAARSELMGALREVISKNRTFANNIMGRWRVYGSERAGGGKSFRIHSEASSLRAIYMPVPIHSSDPVEWFHKLGACMAQVQGNAHTLSVVHLDLGHRMFTQQSARPLIPLQFEQLRQVAPRKADRIPAMPPAPGLHDVGAGAQSTHQRIERVLPDIGHVGQGNEPGIGPACLPQPRNQRSRHAAIGVFAYPDAAT